MTPGRQTATHSYRLAEAAVLALQGEGEAYVRGEWVAFRPGDLAFFPPPVEHAVRATPGGPGLVAVAAISPPEFELYEAAGLWRSLASFDCESDDVPTPIPSSDSHSRNRSPRHPCG